MPDNPTLNIPLVVQVGLAGSCTLYDPSLHPSVNPDAFLKAVTEKLKERLVRLPAELDLSSSHFVCGISQLAIGADTAFTRALQALKWPQRIFLPQDRQYFLSAHGASGNPDFTPEQRDAAEKLFASAHIIQERTVSDALTRDERFRDVNRELVRVSSLIVCLIVDETDSAQPGGTRELIRRAQRKNLPVLEIRLTVKADGTPDLKDEWHDKEKFIAPALPHELAGLKYSFTSLPTIREYCKQLSGFASRTSQSKRNLFRGAAMVIVISHLVATLFAVFALKTTGIPLLPHLLEAELVLLALGFLAHWWLHRTHAVRVWAMAQLVAELARSASALDNVSGYLGHLFFLPLPESLRPLRRTINVLHLRDTHGLTSDTWDERRSRYIETRLLDEKDGQLWYYGRKSKSAKLLMGIGQWSFYAGSFLAIASTLTKLLVALGYPHVSEESHEILATWMGTFAIVFPIVAVGALSLTASFDLEARHHTYSEMKDFLAEQKKQLSTTASERGFHLLALETEARLLGETANWYARRSFTSVT